MKVEVRIEDAAGVRTVGHLLDADRQIHFQYAAPFLASGLQLSPFKLPLGPGVRSEGLREFHGLYGLFFDSLPDGWGLSLMHRRMRERGVDPFRISVLAWLRHLGTRTMGALTYHPADPHELEQPVEVVLADLAAQAVAVFEGEAERVLPELELAGGSPGGARPKVVVGLSEEGRAIAGADTLPSGFSHWLVKFPARGDVKDAAALEEVYARMAREAGLDMPETRLISLDRTRRCFAVRRFDREGAARRHMHTLGGLLHASHRVPSLDYADLLRATGALTRSQAEVTEAFRRMCFNVLACNRDDHVRDFSFLMAAEGEWRLSPAYDLTWSEGISGHHTTSVAGLTDHPTREAILRLAEGASLSRRVADELLGGIGEAVARFATHARAVKLDAGTTKQVGGRLKEISLELGLKTRRRR